jgi:hypothetical protein
MAKFHGDTHMDAEYEEDDYLDLDADEFDGLVVSVPNGLRFPCIYSPQPKYEGRGGDRYGGNIPLNCLPPELHHQVPWKTSERLPELGTYVILKSGVKPEVVPMLASPSGSVGWDMPEAKLRRRAENKLLELVQRLGARNLSTDRLFVGRPLRIELRGLRMGPEFMNPAWRNAPDHVLAGYEGKFNLIPTKVWVDITEDE